MFDSTTIAHIDLEALSNNVKQVKLAAPQSKILALIKCNAYGHGAVEVAKKINSDVDALGVMFLREGLELSNLGIKKPIVILTGFFDSDELNAIDQNGFDSVIHNFEQLDILEKSKLTRPLQVWLKIDTGMHRLGFQPHQVGQVYQRLMEHPMVKKPLRLMTHFSDAEDVNSTKTIDQIKRFEQAVIDFQGEWCLANSAAILNWPEAKSSWVRPGLLLYGVLPFGDQIDLNNGLDLRPVMTLTAKIVAIHEIEKGETIGYGSLFKCSERMRIGTVAVGYGDGYPRNMANAPVLVDGVRTTLLGRVAMDMIAVDLCHIPETKIGSVVTLWGKDLPVEEVARCSGEIPYELFCRLSSRVQYRFYYDNKNFLQ